MVVAFPIFLIPYWSVQEAPYTITIGVFAAMVLWCHQMCIWSNPGHVQKVNILSLSEKEMAHAETEGSRLITQDGHTPCLRCNICRPPQSYHCSQCDACVLKMDHHCPFISNCVGLLTQKHFILLSTFFAQRFVNLTFKFYED